MGVVLDMDETLIHSVFLSDLERLLRKKLKAETLVRDENEISSILKEYRRKADFCIEKSGGIAVNLRPGIHTFLRKFSLRLQIGNMLMLYFGNLILNPLCFLINSTENILLCTKVQNMSKILVY